MNPEDLLRELQDPDRWTNVRVPRAAARGTAPFRVAPGRIAQLVAAFAIAILAAAGILFGLESVRHAAPPAATSTPSTAPAAPSEFTVVPGATHEYSADALPPACTLAQLQTESKQDGGGAAGSYIQTVAIRNSGSDCLLGLDTVRVGGKIVRLQTGSGTHGMIVPALGTVDLGVSAASACQPTGVESNLDEARPVLPIAVHVGGATRTMTARFPQWRCSGPIVDAFLDSSIGTRFASRLPGLDAEVGQPTSTPAGPLSYDVTLRNDGAKALVLSSCPSGTEVLDDGEGTIVTRAITLRCGMSTTLEPDAQVTLPVSTTIPAKADWTISWFLGGGSGTTAVSTTCRLAQLRVSEPGPAGGATGNWVQLVSVRNEGASCTLPVTAFSIGGRVARAGRTKDAGGFRLPAGSTTKVAVAAGTVCADGTVNIASDHALDAKPVVLTLGGQDAGGLDEPFPQLHCAGPYVDLVG